MNRRQVIVNLNVALNDERVAHEKTRIRLNGLVEKLKARSDSFRACRGMETLGEWAQKEADWLDETVKAKP